MLSIGCLISSLGRGLCSGIDSILLGRRGCTGGVSTRRVTVVGGFSSSGSESFLRWRVQQWRVNQAARTELQELISVGWRYTGKIGCVVSGRLKMYDGTQDQLTEECHQWLRDRR